MAYFLTILYYYFQLLIWGVAIHVLFPVAGVLFLGFPVILLVSRYTLAISQKAGFDPLVAALFGVIAGLVMSGFFILLHRRFSEEGFVVMGVASVLAFQSLAHSWTGVTNGVLGISGIQRPELFSTLPQLVFLAFVIAALALTAEWVLLKSPLGRQLRALKESPMALASLGVSPERRTELVLLGAGALFSVGGFLFLWLTHFMEPQLGGLVVLVEVLTIGILARRPKISGVIWSALFVIGISESLRFLSLPASMFAQVRILLYGVLLIVLIHLLYKKITLPNRTI